MKILSISAMWLLGLYTSEEGRFRYTLFNCVSISVLSGSLILLNTRCINGQNSERLRIFNDFSLEIRLDVNQGWTVKQG